MIKSTEVSDLNHSATGAAIFCFSQVVRAIENDANYRKENFSISPMPRVMDPKSLPAEKKCIDNSFLFHSCCVSTIENDDVCRKRNFSIQPMTRVTDLNSLPAEKSFVGDFLSF